MPKATINFVGQAYNLPATQLDAQTSINWYLINDLTGKFKRALIRRPGLELYFEDTEHKECRGAFVLNEKLFVVIDNKFYEYRTNNSREELGTLNSSTGRVRMISNRFQIFITDNDYGYVYQIIANEAHPAGDFFVIEYASSQIGDPVFTGTGLNDMSTTGTYIGTTAKIYRVQIDSGLLIEVIFFGLGLNDLTVSGKYVGEETKIYLIRIDSVGTRDTFKWSEDGGSTWNRENIPITGLNQFLEDGIYIRFAATTGHTLDDTWQITAFAVVQDTFKWSDDNGATWQATNIEITTGDQLLNDGVYVTFLHASGHTLNDFWSFETTIDSAFYVPIIPAYQDGYGIYIKQESYRFYLSRLDDFSYVNALDYASANALPDNLVAAVSIHDELWLLCKNTTEVWYDTANPDFPFQKRSNLLINYGCEAPYTLQVALNNYLYFLGRNKDGGRIVIQIVDYNPVIISTEPINDELRNYSKIDDAFAEVIERDGHVLYILTFPTEDKTWVYDITAQSWYEWRSELPNQLPSSLPTRQGRFLMNFHVFYNGENLIGDFRTGNIYKMNDNYYLDGDRPIKCERVTQHTQEDLQWISINSLQIDGESGEGLNLGQGQEPMLMLQVSKDGGKSYGSELWRTSGKIGAYKNRALWYRLGAGRVFTFKLTVTDPVFTSIFGAVADIEVFD